MCITHLAKRVQDTRDRLAGLLRPVLQMCRTIEGGLTRIPPSEHLHVPTEPRDVVLVVGVSVSCSWTDKALFTLEVFCTPYV